MLSNNYLLKQLKNKLKKNIMQVEGTVKAHERGFGFLEIDIQNSYFIPPYLMKKVIHGDKITADIYEENNKKIAIPKTLIEPYLSRFVGQITTEDNEILISPNHPLINKLIILNIKTLKNEKKNRLKNGDWVTAKITHHPLQGYNKFQAEIINFITNKNNNFAPWLVTLEKYNLEQTAPQMPKKITQQKNENIIRKNLTKLDFFTIDSPATKDIDDALYITKHEDNTLTVQIAIADPTYWITENSILDITAKKRGFTNYLPGINIPMLPRMLSDNLCSLQINKTRPALVCQVTIKNNGDIKKNIHFYLAWIKSKAQLSYDNVSDWIEKKGTWEPKNRNIEEQILLLYKMYKIRNSWRKNNAFLFEDKPDYRFILNNNKEIEKIIIEPKRIANKMIEEAMITANSCAAQILQKNLGFGMYNIHEGFDSKLIHQAINILKKNNIQTNLNELTTLKGFCKLRKKINSMSDSLYINNQIKKLQTFSSIGTKPSPHFGLGLKSYATWTSPIRKYSDIINHRLLKAIIGIGKITKPSKETAIKLSEKKRQNRMAEKDIENWLYTNFYKKKIRNKDIYQAEIWNIYKGGMKIKLIQSGAIAFIPSSFIHNIKHEIICNHENGIITIKGKKKFRQGDIINVILYEVKIKRKSIIAKLI